MTLKLSNATEAERDFIAQVEQCTIAHEAFRHTEHIHLAWLYLRALPFDAAAARIGTTLRRLATHHGVPERYHETLTVAFMYLVRHHLRQDEPFEDFRTRMSLLFDDARGLIARHYSTALIEGADARARFVPPDIAPLPQPRDTSG